MSRQNRLLMLAAHLMMLAAIALLLLSAHGLQTKGPNLSDVKTITTMTASVNGGPETVVTLPHSFEHLTPRTPVVLEAVITPRTDDVVYIKSVYSPAEIYLDGRFVYAFGTPEHYPAFMNDPGTEVHMVETGGTGEEMVLRMEFHSPVSRSTMVIHPPMVGSAKELISQRQHALGLPLCFALIQSFAGFGLIAIALYIMLLDRKGELFLWLGLFSLASGLWAFGENNFTHIVLKNTATLYLLSFIGFFTFIVPLLHFIRAIIDFETPWPVWFMELFFACSALAALLLQFMGLVDCCRSMYFFHIFLPPALVILLVLTIHEAVCQKNINARRLILPIAILALSALLELLNYRMPFTYVFSSLFQMGILFFLLVMGIMAALSIKDSIDLRNRQKELSFEKELLDQQIKEQEHSSQLLDQHEALLRQQRHDLRHHLAAIQELARDENQELQAYLQTLMEQVPTPEQSFCENRAVNAILSRYAAICSRQGIELTLQVVVPPCRGRISDTELCIIFGNLLENAVEACGRMTEGRRFIKLNSSLQYDMLTITMDNSFQGSVHMEEGRFRSSKRDDFGVGLSSVRTVARKAGGDVDFRTDGNLFLSSVYVQL